MKKILNIVGHMMSDQDISCVYSYAIEDPEDLLMDLIEHKSEDKRYVLVINNKGMFGHNYRITLSNSELGVYLLQSIRKSIRRQFQEEYEITIDIDKIVHAVEATSK